MLSSEEMSVSERSQFVAPPYVASMQLIESYSEIDEVLRSADFIQGSHIESGVFLDGSLIKIEGEEHMARRQIFSALVSRAAMHHYENGALIPVIRKVMGELRAAGPGVDGVYRVDLLPLLLTMLHRITALVTGVDNVDTKERTERFRTLVVKLTEAVTAEWSTRGHDEVVKEGLETRRLLVNEFLLPSLERRRELARQYKEGKIAKEALPTDLLMLLCLHGDDARPDDDTYVWREASLFLVASIHTTAQALPHVMVHLTDWFKKHPEDYDKRLDSSFLRLAAMESLRLHQPVPTLLRIAANDVVLSTGRKVKKGERVALFFVPANRDKSLFGSDANEYNPHRQGKPRLSPWGLTFGGGVHTCIGRPLVTGMFSRPDDRTGTEGTMIRMLHTLFEAGAEMDPERPPIRTAISYSDAYATFPLILRNIGQSA